MVTEGGCLMVELIEFPTNKVAPDYLPQPGDDYEAYGLWHKVKPPMLAFVFADWSMRTFRYDKLGYAGFKFLGNDEDGGEITLTFVDPLGWADVIITGPGLFHLFSSIGGDCVRWIWEVPKERAIVNGAPVVHSIVIHRIDDARKAGTIP